MLITPHSEPTPILSFSLNFKWLIETLGRTDLDSGLPDTSACNRGPGEAGSGARHRGKLIEMTHQSHISQSGSDTGKAIVRPSLAHPDITLWTNCMDILFYHPLHYAIDGSDLSKMITIPAHRPQTGACVRDEVWCWCWAVVEAGIYLEKIYRAFI